MNTSLNTDIYTIAKENCNLLNTTFEILTQCNWRCEHCYLPEHTNLGMSYDKIISIFKELRNLGVFELTLTGGELFYRKDIMSIIQAAREMHFFVYLFTNISLLNEDMVKKLSTLYISKISCTIFSLDENIHDSITGVKGSLKKALSNAQLLKKYNIPLEIKTILMKKNYNSYIELEKYCKVNGFEYLATATVFPQNNGDCSHYTLQLSEEQLKKVLPKIDTIRNFGKRQLTDDDYICNSIHHSIAIDCNGKVYPCNNMQIEIGDLTKESLLNIWNNSKTLKYIQGLKRKDLIHCKNCDSKDYCYRCAGVAHLENGSLLEKSPCECMQAHIRYAFNNQ